MNHLRSLRILLTPLIQQTKPEAALLLPLRLFIGLGWLRAGLEKLLYSDVVSAAWLTDFFVGQLDDGLVVFSTLRCPYRNRFHTLRAYY